MRVNLIAFTGYGGSGKDEAAKPLIEAGYVRRCFGDTIKGQVDEVVKRHLGFSAFTENRTQKPLIRRTLESWGEDNYEGIFREFFTDLPDRCVNTRLCRLREAQEWTRRGGVIVEVRRKGIVPETDWARDRVTELRRAKLIYTVLDNNGTLPELHASVRELFELASSSPELLTAI